MTHATGPRADMIGLFLPLPCTCEPFLHYAFDEWMRRNYPRVLFERYADDVLAHAVTRTQAQSLPEAIYNRLKQCHTELHPEKTKIVYLQDSDRRGKREHIKFDSLGYTSRAGRAKNRWRTLL